MAHARMSRMTPIPMRVLLNLVDSSVSGMGPTNRGAVAPPAKRTIPMNPAMIASATVGMLFASIVAGSVIVGVASVKVAKRALELLDD